MSRSRRLRGWNNEVNEMEDDKLYRQALEEMEELAERVLKECCEFADDNDYEKEWVISHFMSAFNNLKIKRAE